MHATEFKTVINDPYIKIPDYELFKGHEVRVTLLDIEKRETKKRDDFIEFLINHPVDVEKDLEFLSREEANER